MRSGWRRCLLLAGAVALAGCGTSGALDGASLAPGATPAATASTPPSSAAASPSASAGTGSSQADTAWGKIWDTLPSGFPAIPGATASEEGATGAASAVLTLQGQSAKDVASLMQRLLSGAGYSTQG